MHTTTIRLYEAAETLRNLTTPAAVARALNQSSQTLKNWETRGMSKAGMLIAQAAIGCSATWLEFGTGPMRVAATNETEAQSGEGEPFLGDSTGIVMGELTDVVPVRRVTLQLRAGITGFQTEHDYEDGGVLHIARADLEAARLAAHNLLAIRINGTSMEPMLHSGDTVVIDVSDREPLHKECYAVNFGGEGMVKQLLRRGNEWFLHSMNADYPDENVRSKPCSIVGRMVFQPGRIVKGRF